MQIQDCYAPCPEAREKSSMAALYRLYNNGNKAVFGEEVQCFQTPMCNCLRD